MVGMIKKHVEKIYAAADLYDIVSATVTLKSSGTGTFVGLCPFHDEKTGSFNVRPSLGVWHCFGCGWVATHSNTSNNPKTSTDMKPRELLADKYRHRAALREQRQWPGDGENTGSKRTRLLEACEEAPALLRLL